MFYFMTFTKMIPWENYLINSNIGKNLFPYIELLRTWFLVIKFLLIDQSPRQVVRSERSPVRSQTLEIASFILYLLILGKITNTRKVSLKYTFSSRFWKWFWTPWGLVMHFNYIQSFKMLMLNCVGPISKSHTFDLTHLALNRP